MSGGSGEGPEARGQLHGLRCRLHDSGKVLDLSVPRLPHPDDDHDDGSLRREGGDQRAPE